MGTSSKHFSLRREHSFASGAYKRGALDVRRLLERGPSGCLFGGYVTIDLRCVQQAYNCGTNGKCAIACCKRNAAWIAVQVGRVGTPWVALVWSGRLRALLTLKRECFDEVSLETTCAVADV